MVFLNSEETKLARPLMRVLDQQVFGAELLYSESKQVEERIQHPMSIYASAIDDEKKEMLAYISLTITTERYYQKLLKGEAKEEEFEPWSEGETPLLFLRNLVARDRRATPYIFRNATKELLKICAQHEIYIHRTFTIASHWITKRILKNYQFEEVGKYQGNYPIFMAGRDKSPVLNSFLKRYTV